MSWIKKTPPEENSHTIIALNAVKTMSWIKDKTPPKENSYAVIALRVDSESVDYTTAIFSNGSFILAYDEIGRVYTLDDIEGYLPFDIINA